MTGNQGIVQITTGDSERRPWGLDQARAAIKQDSSLHVRIQAIHHWTSSHILRTVLTVLGRRGIERLLQRKRTLRA